MAQSAALLKKLARNAKMLGLTVNSETGSSFEIENGSNDLNISYVDASFSPQVVGGVDHTVSPYLGIGVGSPGAIRIKSSINTNSNISDVMDSEVAARVLAMCASLANDIILENSDASFSMRIRGHSDLVSLGQ